MPKVPRPLLEGNHGVRRGVERNRGEENGWGLGKVAGREVEKDEKGRTLD